jgi:hypothetical protein
MFSFIFIAFLLSLNFFSAESLVTMLVGGLVSFGLTNWIKNQTGAIGFGAMLLALFISVLVAVVAVGCSMFLSGDGFSWDKAAASAIQVFGVATIAYKALMADKR